MSHPTDYHSLPAISSLLDAITAPAILMNRDYQICAANEAYRQTFSQDQALLSRHCYEVSHGYRVPCDQAGETCPLRQCLDSGQRQRILHIHNTANGREHVDVELNPIRDDEGEIRYFIEIMHPVRSATDNPASRMVGYSAAYTQMLELLSRAAPSDISVLLLGESGTGKELAAQYLHSHSDRAASPFVTVECSGLTETLFESELFGHEKGAFTGATHRKPGLVEAARGGTLFLDEVGDIPLAMQVKLLRLIESGSYRPVGSITPKQADFRLICATHQKLEEMISEGTFRKDLYYRISPFPVYLPTLNERPEDIIPLATHLLEQLSRHRVLQLSDRACDWLISHKYRGNIRELRNLLERAVLLCDGNSVEPEHLEPFPASSAILSSESITLGSSEILPLANLESVYLERIARAYTGDNAALAKKLGVSERTLYRKLRQLRDQHQNDDI
ncbi:MAG: Fis family transcriptional regulator [Oceanospirillaceae bacterium]|uniref:sigma-54 interaction domain-containing protein n=1 Tax=unclassified Thalassolituus TaxID=2624967 RepID=UPI000C4C9B89|nr:MULTISPECIES: sigma 54-interacting transcriptional regulator [unclassified Thalassolituus]MAS25134.1 Fis family transcriptional regulator [Oceanospirillaceae bacterium]MAY00653.1 Fis family transcriptional regulator [Oceanospirillaceae bacterium]MBL36306.1 Fis family transcriptional regulator [Oceanospirillaceae bacterium]MBS53993.1 Fis family transcriptional regulator [Oceanospirillaceae bacterium]|tara:strand:+ start:4730 stop:6073 length:1344 start_codon:yes stop_codon:yes gene_type:complete